jgi:hypothetical protein
MDAQMGFSIHATSVRLETRRLAPSLEDNQIIFNNDTGSSKVENQKIPIFIDRAYKTVYSTGLSRAVRSLVPKHFMPTESSLGQ